MLLATPWLHFQWNRYNVAVIMYVGNYLVPDTPAARHYIDPFILAFTAKHMLGGAPRIITFAHLWSLTVEEQFYCIWPAVVWMVRKRGRLLTLCLVVVAAMPFLRLLFSHFVGSGVAGGAVYGSLFFRMDTLLFGGALALWLRGTSLSAATIRKGARTTAIVAPTIFIVGYYLCPSPGDATFFSPFVFTFGYSLIAIAAGAVLLLSIDPLSRLQPILRARPLAATGRISYGLYFFHGLPTGICYYYMKLWKPHHLDPLVPVIALAFTWIAASLSYRFVEAPFLRLKSILAPTRGMQHPVPESPADEHGATSASPA